MAEENTTDKGKNPAQGATTDGNATCVPHEPFPTIQQLQQLQQAGVSTEDFQKWIEDKAARAQQSSTPLPTQIASATTGKASLETPTKAAKRGKATEESPAVSSAEKRHSNPKRAKTAKGRSRKLKAELEALISEHPPISEYVSFHWYFNRRLEDFDPPQIIIDELARSAPDTSQSNHTIWKSLVKPLGEIQKHVQGPNQNRWDQVWGTTVKMPRLPTSTQLQALRYLDQKKGPVIGDALLARFKNADLLWFANGGPPTEFWRGAMLDDPTWRLEYMEKGENTPSSAIDTSGLIDLMKEVFPSRPAGLKMLNVAEDAGSGRRRRPRFDLSVEKQGVPGVERNHENAGPGRRRRLRFNLSVEKQGVPGVESDHKDEAGRAAQGTRNPNTPDDNNSTMALIASTKAPQPSDTSGTADPRQPSGGIFGTRGLAPNPSLRGILHRASDNPRPTTATPNPLGLFGGTATGFYNLDGETRSGTVRSGTERSYIGTTNQGDVAESDQPRRDVAESGQSRTTVNPQQDLDNPFTDKLRGAMAIGLSKTLAKVTKMEQTIEQLRVQVDLKRSLLVTANERIEEMEQTIEQLRVQVDSKTSLLVTANEEIEKMEQTIKQLESKAGDNMKERWSVVEDQVAELKEQAKSERVARERLEAGLKTLRQQLEKRGLSPVDE